MNPTQIFLSLIGGFLPGSIPFGHLAGLINRIDVRKTGSGNIGFTNVYRVLGWKWALPVLILDITKGLLPVAFASSLGLLPALVGLGAVTGHIFTPWLKLQGGKGVATTIGVTAILCPRSFIAGIGVYLLILLLSGFISLSSLIFALTLPFLTWLFYPQNPLLLTFTIGIGIIIVIRHIANIRRLLNGTEPKFGLWQKLFHPG